MSSQGGLPALQEMAAATAAVSEGEGRSVVMAEDRLPPIGKSSIELQRSQRRLELESRAHDLQKKQDSLRSTILGYEYEARYRLLWAYQRESERLRVSAADAGKVGAAWQQSNYLASVRAFQRWGAVWSEETNHREELVKEEEDGWEGLLGWHAVRLLSIEHEKLQRERVEAIERFDALDGVRQMELEVQLAALRTAKPYQPKPPVENVSSTIITGKPSERAISSKKKRVEYLMDYTVNEEEFQVRQRLRREEAIERLQLTAVVEKQVTLAQEEFVERFKRYDIFYHGCQDGRLQRVLTIQRWWRMVRKISWRTHARSDLRRALRHLRARELPSTFYLRKLAMIEKPRQSPSEEKQLYWQTLAAKRLYQTAALDEYVISLQRLWDTFVIQQEHQCQVKIDRCLQSKIDAVSAITLVASESDEEWKARRGCQQYLDWLRSHSEPPIRIFNRIPTPYDAWRARRWHAYTAKTLQGLDDCREEEAAIRAEWVAEWAATNQREMSLWSSLLASGDEAAVKALQFQIGELEQEESEERHQVAQSECTLWSDILIVKATWDEQHVQPALALWGEMMRGRRLLSKKEADARAVLNEGHWRWASLSSARSRIAATYPSRAIWNISCRCDAATAFRSLDAVANIIRRFFFRHVKKKPILSACGDAEVTEELVLQLRAAKAAFRLEQLMKESAAQIKASAGRRAREKKANVELNGSSGGLFSESVAGFSCVPRRVAAAEQAARGEEEDDISRVGPWIYFRRWMVSNMESERDWREVLARFQSTNKEFYNNFAFLLSLMREGREKIEAEEAEVRYRLRFRQTYRDWVSHVVHLKESRQRRLLVAEEQDTRYHLMLDLRTMKTALRWGGAKQPLLRRATQRPYYLAVQRAPVRHVRPEESDLLIAARHAYMNIPHVQHPRCPEDCLLYHHNGPTLRQILTGQLLPDGDALRTATNALISASAAERKPAMPIARLSAVERLVAREGVRRAAVEVQRKKELASFLEGFGVPFRVAIITEEAARCRRICIRVDSKFPTHPLVACGRLLMVEESEARAALEEEAWEAYQLPLLAAHRQYLYHRLAMNFTLGHWTMSGHAQYLDKRLSALLTQRVRHVKEKLQDLIDHEAASRQRLEYMAEVEGDMRFLWKKG